MTRLFCQEVGGCIQRCMGVDAVNAIYTVSYEADEGNKGATEYHENFKKWLMGFQSQDLVGCCAQTDVKGDRLKRPSQQPDPDSYLRVVEKKADGIVVRGCKVHISEAAIADEILVTPTRALMEADTEAKHVTDKFAEIIKVTELAYAAGFTASAMGKPELYILAWVFAHTGTAT